MNIQERINQDLKLAMLAKNDEKKTFLRVIIGELNRKGKEFTDAEVIKELRKLEENAKMLDNQFEIELLSHYLPQKFSDNDVKIIVENIIIDNNITSIRDMGKIMGMLKVHPSSSLIDNTVASKYIREILH